MIDVEEYTVSLGLNGTVYVVDSQTKSTLHIRYSVAKRIAEAIEVMSVRGERRVRIQALEHELALLRAQDVEERELLGV